MGGAQLHMALAARVGLTARERDCLNAIEGYVQRHAFSPSLEDLGKLLGLSSKSGVHRLVDGLEQRGWIRKLPNKARSIEIVSERGIDPDPSRAWQLTLSPKLNAALRNHCLASGDQPADVMIDAVSLFLDQAEADQAARA